MAKPRAVTQHPPLHTMASGPWGHVLAFSFPGDGQSQAHVCSGMPVPRLWGEATPTEMLFLAWVLPSEGRLPAGARQEDLSVPQSPPRPLTEGLGGNESGLSVE